MEQGTKGRRNRTGFNFFVLVIFIAIAVGSIFMLRNELLNGAQNTGTALARLYAIEEQSHIEVYENLLALGAQYLDERVESGYTGEELTRWMKLYFDSVSEYLGDNIVDPYAVVDGRVYAADPQKGEAAERYAGTEWYVKAIEADGKSVFTDTYEDAATGRQVFTISQKCRHSDSVMAFDIFPEDFHSGTEGPELPEKSSYYLCDSNGVPLYVQSGLKFEGDSLDEYLKELTEAMDAGELDDSDSYKYDLEGERRGVYFFRLDNGWVSIVTIPFDVILKDLDAFTGALSLVFAVFLSYTTAATWRENRASRMSERVNETIRVLGNAYYALYRVDYVHGTYEMIKGSEYVAERLLPQGNYSELLGVLKDVIDENTYSDFLTSFSQENIGRLVKNHVHNFGGDFTRLFGDKYKWFNVCMLYDESLMTDEVVLAFKEVDEEKNRQLEQRSLLENALEAAKKSEKTKNAFFSNMSHDMRTPLNAILGLAELARQNLDNRKKLGDYIDKIESSGRQLLSLINDILEMSRLEQGKVRMDFKEMDIGRCIEECCSIFSIQAERQNKFFQFDEEITCRRVYGDPLRISQIMNNLLSNAIKFTPEKGRISVKLKQLDYMQHIKYQITVSDTGIGMSDEFVGRIFEPYARETRFGAHSVSGTGLGMPIVKSLVMQMSGEITVESSLGEGSTFTVTLPLEKAESTAEEKQQAEKGNGFVSLEGKHILLAEDNEINMEIATEMLSAQGVDISQAWNGREAVDMFAASGINEFDAVLMDMQMPVLDGCSAAMEIRALSRADARTVPIIAVTANAFAEDIAKTTEAGMNAHISKPIDFSVLTRVLSELTS